MLIISAFRVLDVQKKHAFICVTSSFDVLLLSTSKYTKITNIKKYLYFFYSSLSRF